MKKFLAVTITVGMALSLIALVSLMTDFNANRHGFVIEPDSLTDVLDQQRAIQRATLQANN